VRVSNDQQQQQLKLVHNIQIIPCAKPVKYFIYCIHKRGVIAIFDAAQNLQVHTTRAVHSWGEGQ
jgi:hypothetical protein